MQDKPMVTLDGRFYEIRLEKPSADDIKHRRLPKVVLVEIHDLKNIDINCKLVGD